MVATRDTIVEPAPREPVGPPPPDRRIGAGMLLALGALALVAIGIAIAYLLTHRNDKQTTTVVVTSGPAPAAKVVVPDLAGESFAAAQGKLDTLGLASTRTDVTSTEKPGTVVGQAPNAGAQAAKGSTVTLTVAKASSTAPRPDDDGRPRTTTGTTTTAATTTSSGTPPTPGERDRARRLGPDRAGGGDGLQQRGRPREPRLRARAGPARERRAAGEAGRDDRALPRARADQPLARPRRQAGRLRSRTRSARRCTDAVSTMNGAGLRLIFVKLPVTSASQIGKVVQQSPLSGGKAPQNAQVLVYLGAKAS